MCTNTNSNKCEICGCGIEVGVDQYSHLFLEECSENGSYYVICDEDIITTCTECHENFNADREIDKLLAELFRIVQNGVENKRPVIPIHDNCACVNCKKPIEDKDPLILVKYSRNSVSQTEDKSVDIAKPYQLCQVCLNDVDNCLNHMRRQYDEHSASAEYFMKQEKEEVSIIEPCPLDIGSLH